MTKDIRRSSPIRSKAFAKYVGEKILVFHITTGLVNTGILISVTKYTIRYKTTSGEIRVKKDDVFLVNYDCYDRLVDLVNNYVQVRSDLETMVNNNAIL